jgi:hypothetical protein
MLPQMIVERCTYMRADLTERLVGMINNNKMTLDGLSPEAQQVVYNQTPDGGRGAALAGWRVA